MEKNNKTILLDASCPMLVSGSDNESVGEFNKRWEIFDKLPEEKKDILSSLETSKIIAEIISRNNLTIKDAVEISRIVRSVIFGLLDQEAISKEISNKITNIKQSSDNIKNDIVQKILSGSKKNTEISKKNTYIKISLTEAIRQYPKIAEQPITGSPIKLRSFPAPARPSVKNWIADYREHLGAGRHGMVERGNYLFQSENTRRISSAERQKLAWVLKSLEENTPLDIDSENEIIIFPESKEPAREPVPKYPAAEAPKIPAAPPVQNSAFRPAPPKPQDMNEISPSLNRIKNLSEAEIKKPEPPKIFQQGAAANSQPSAPPKPAEEKKIHYVKPPINRIEPIGDFDEDGNGNVVNLKGN